MPLRWRDDWRGSVFTCAVRWATKSPITHCAIGYEGWVLHSGLHENKLVKEDNWFWNAPGLTRVYALSCVSEPPDLAAYRGEPVPPRRERVRGWLQMDDKPVLDCVGIAREVLCGSCCYVPRTVRSPAALDRYLEANRENFRIARADFAGTH